MRRLGPLLLLSLVSGGAANAGNQLYAGAIAQPLVRWEQEDTQQNVTNPQHSGFALRHARAYAVGSLAGRLVTWDARIEVEMASGFQLLDAWASASANLPRGGGWRITVGQHFAPFSRQTILSVGDLQMVEPAQLTGLTPGRQLGISGLLIVPAVPSLQLSVGVFNGKGINVLDNVDDNFMYVGRIAFRPVGTRAPLIESALGPNAIWVAVDFSYNKQKPGDYSQYQYLVGADAFLSWAGASVYAEYLWGDTHYSKGSPKPAFNTQGLNVQAGYLLPIPGFLYRRLEITARYEAVAPNRTIAIAGPGDPTQGRAVWVAGLGYYHRGHNLKVQANYYHRQELDDKTTDGKDASYANDAVLVQLTYRLE
jgi:hypothetical protein